MQQYCNDIKEVVNKFENNKIKDYELLDYLWDIITEMDKDITFEVKVKTLTKKDHYFENFDSEIKNNIREIINKYAIFKNQNRPQQICIYEKIKIKDLEKLSEFLNKIGFYVSMETDDIIIYSSRKI